MLYESIADRYASALFQVASEHREVMEWEQKLLSIVETLKGHRFLSGAILSPQITVEIKKAMLQKVFAPLIPPQLLNFLNILADKGREHYLEAILKKYREKVREMEGKSVAQVTVAVPMTPSMELSITEALSRLSGKKVMLESSVDPEILGGVVIRMEGKILDWSIAGHLLQIKEKMVSGVRG